MFIQSCLCVYQCTVQNETVSFCTVHHYTHKQDWINMQPQDQAISITQ